VPPPAPISIDDKVHGRNVTCRVFETLRSRATASSLQCPIYNTQQQLLWRQQ